MFPYHILQRIDPELGIQILQEVRAEDESMFKTAINSLAHMKKLRPIFVQKKSREAQAEWVLKTASLKPYNDVAEHLLQLWLLRSRNPMLCQFLDAMEISHDGAGSTDEMPEDLPTLKLKGVVDRLLEEHPAVEVSIYLWMFQMQREGGWETLEELLESDLRLKIGS